MKNFTIARLFFFFSFISVSFSSFGQTTTSWIGITSRDWITASNWTNGVPTATTSAILGDANFTGINQPTIGAVATCLNLTVGGTRATTLTVNKPISVRGDVLLTGNGAINQGKTNISVSGNWTNNGSYSFSSINAIVSMAGTMQTIGGATATAFRRLTVNSGSSTTLSNNITVVILTVSGTFNPSEVPTYLITSGGGGGNSVVVNNGGILRVNASTFTGNYSGFNAITLNAGSTVDYSSTTVNQTVSSTYTYSTLRISGTGTKTLDGNLLPLNSSAIAEGNILVASGTLDLSTFTANRGTSVAGGTLRVLNNAFLKIGGNNPFPANYQTINLNLTSTVEYYGAGVTQVVAAQTYGNLLFTSASGTSVRTMPVTAFTIAGNFTSSVTAGTLSYTAASNITVSGNVVIGSLATFNGGSFTVTTLGNWSNNGTFTGNTGTVVLNGSGRTISGGGSHNFNNLTLTASGINADAITISVGGNLQTSGSGEVTQSGGTLQMSGTTKNITGTGITLANLTILTGATITTSSSFTINSNLSVAGSFTSTNNDITFRGANNSITNTGTLVLSSVTIAPSANISTASSFSISTLLDVEGTFNATANTITFSGNSALNGTANLFNTTVSSTFSLQLSTNAVLGIAGILTLSGTLNVISSAPNTVNYNATLGTQNVLGITYHNLTFSGGATKQAAAAVTVNGNITIGVATTFNAGAFTHNILGNWVNSGTLTSTGIMNFLGADNASISGVTTFNTLTINKVSATNQVTLLSNISAAIVNMTSGVMLTDASILTLTNTRTGNGFIYGTITRTHTFASGTSYAFEGPNNTINFTGSSITSVTLKVVRAVPTDFPFGASINRFYDITNITGAYTNATFRIHYEDIELNGNDENSAEFLPWRYNGTTWGAMGRTATDATANYVELSGIINITDRWTISNVANVVSWNGSVSSDWNTAANWNVLQGSGSTPPSINDIVQIGVSTFNFQPTIATAVSVKSITFGSAKAATLTLASGSLTTSGNISGNYLGTVSHTIIAGNQNINVGGDLILNDGTTGRVISLSIGGGTVSVGNSVTQSGGANIIFTGSGTLSIQGNFNQTSGTFTPSTGTVIYNGTGSQIVAAVTYNNLTINKTTGIAALSAAASLSGNLTITTGELNFTNTLTITGNLSMPAASSKLVSIGTGSILIAGNWDNNSGSFTAANGTITFNGTGAQTILAFTFNNLVINKASGTATLLRNLQLNGNLTVNAGSLNISTFTANRATAGGLLTMGANTFLFVSGATNFPGNFGTYTFDNTSTTEYNGLVAQSVIGITYGNLTFTNSSTKNLLANTTIAGNLNINSGATFTTSIFTITLNGNFSNAGSFSQTTGVVLMYGIGRSITGTTTFNRVTMYGNYTVSTGSTITFDGEARIVSGGTFNFASNPVIISGDLLIDGTLISNGTATFTGAVLQNIRLTGTYSSTAAGVVNFNGTIAPVFNSTSAPQFATLNINNTAGISPSVGWTVLVAFNVASGSSFNGGISTHNFRGTFNNNGTVTSSGTLNIIPQFTVGNIQLAGSSFSSIGIVNFGGTVGYILSGAASFKDIVIANTIGVSPTANWSVTKSFVINTNAIFNAGANTYTVAGDIYSNGTLNGGTSTFSVTVNGAQIFGSAGTTFYNLSTTAGTLLLPITFGSDFYVNRNFTNTGVLDAIGGSMVFTGSENSIIGGLATYDLQQFDVNKNTGATVTLASNITMGNSYNILSGTLDIADKTITQDASSPINDFNISAGAFLKVGGINSSIPIFTIYNLDSLSTVEYYSTGAQTVKSLSLLKTTTGTTSAYGHLIISGTGTKTADGTLNIRSNFTLATATINFNNFADTLGGNFTMTSGTLTPGTGVFVFNGGANQNLSSTGSFNNININKPAGFINFLTNMIATGAISFTLGKIYTNAFTFIVPTGTVTGAGQTTGWVNGRLQKNLAIGSNVTRIFEVGGANIYSPVSILLTSVTAAGNLTASATGTDHPELLYSGIDANTSVNRYWTLTNAGIVFTTNVNNTATLNWVASDVDAGAVTANFITGLYNNSGWTLPTNASPLATSIQSKGFSTFGDFAVGQGSPISTWTGAAGNSDWLTQANWAGGLPTTTKSALIPSALISGRLYPVLNAGTGEANNITIQNNASLTVSGSGLLQISGTINSTGVFDVSAGTLLLNGSIAQTINGTVFKNKTIKNILINNNVNVIGSDTLKISGSLGFDALASNKTFDAGSNNVTLLSTQFYTANVNEIKDNNRVLGNNYTVERFISTGVIHGKSWQLLGTAVTGQSVLNSWQEGKVFKSGYGTNIPSNITHSSFDGLAIGASMKVYNPLTNVYDGITRTDTLLANPKGYFIFVRGDRSVVGINGLPNKTILRSSGTLNTGNSLPNVAIPAGAFATVGNPFPSTIDLRKLYADHSSFLNFDIYVWDPNLSGAQGVGGYRTLTYLNGDYRAIPAGGFYSTISNYIQSGQAFFVRSNGATGNIDFKERYKRDTSNLATRTQQGQVPIIQTTLNGGLKGTQLVMLDGALVIFGQEYSNEVNFEDANKFSNAGVNTGFVRTGRTLAVERRRMPTESDTLHISFTGVKQLAYTWNIKLENINVPGLQAWLWDKYLNTKTALLNSNTTEINFSVDANTTSIAADRFKIVFTHANKLPVKISAIDAVRLADKSIAVIWNVENENNVSLYTIERSAKGMIFNNLAVQQPMFNNVSNRSYKYLDAQTLAGDSYYRIKALSAGGRIQYSNIVKVKALAGPSSMTVVTNPVLNRVVNLFFVNKPEGNYDLSLTNSIGQIVYKGQLTLSNKNENRKIRLVNVEAAGVYQLTIIDPDRTIVVQKIMIE